MSRLFVLIATVVVLVGCAGKNNLVRVPINNPPEQGSPVDEVVNDVMEAMVEVGVLDSQIGLTDSKQDERKNIRYHNVRAKLLNERFPKRDSLSFPYYKRNIKRIEGTSLSRIGSLVLVGDSLPAVESATEINGSKLPVLNFRQFISNKELNIWDFEFDNSEMFSIALEASGHAEFISFLEVNISAYAKNRDSRKTFIATEVNTYQNQLTQQVNEVSSGNLSSIQMDLFYALWNYYRLNHYTSNQNRYYISQLEGMVVEYYKTTNTKSENGIDGDYNLSYLGFSSNISHAWSRSSAIESHCRYFNIYIKDPKKDIIYNLLPDPFLLNSAFMKYDPYKHEVSNQIREVNLAAPTNNRTTHLITMYFGPADTVWESPKFTVTLDPKNKEENVRSPVHLGPYHVYPNPSSERLEGGGFNKWKLQVPLTLDTEYFNNPGNDDQGTSDYRVTVQLEDSKIRVLKPQETELTNSGAAVVSVAATDAVEFPNDDKEDSFTGSTQSQMEHNELKLTRKYDMKVVANYKPYIQHNDESLKSEVIPSFVRENEENSYQWSIPYQIIADNNATSLHVVRNVDPSGAGDAVYDSLRSLLSDRSTSNGNTKAIMLSIPLTRWKNLRELVQQLPDKVKTSLDVTLISGDDSYKKSFDVDLAMPRYGLNTKDMMALLLFHDLYKKKKAKMSVYNPALSIFYLDVENITSYDSLIMFLYVNNLTDWVLSKDQLLELQRSNSKEVEMSAQTVSGDSTIQIRPMAEIKEDVSNIILAIDATNVINSNGSSGASNLTESYKQALRKALENYRLELLNEAEGNAEDGVVKATSISKDSQQDDRYYLNTIELQNMAIAKKLYPIGAVVKRTQTE